GAPGVRAQLDKLKNTTPEERAKAQTEYLTSRLGLTAEQTTSVGALNMRYARSSSSGWRRRSRAGGNSSSLRAQHPCATCRSKESRTEPVFACGDAMD